MKNSHRVSFKRQAGSVRNTVIVVVLLIVLGLVAIPWYADYTPRAKVAETIVLTAPLKNSITEFHVNNKRFPTPQETEKFRADSGKYAQSVVYDAEKRVIVVTMGDTHKDKRFAIHAEEKDGMISWACRTIDLNPRYLPSACR